MDKNNEIENEELLHLTAGIVSAYVANNQSNSTDLQTVIKSTYETLASLGTPTLPIVELVPACSASKSVSDSTVTCMDCGWKGKMLKRHLSSAHNLTPESYRAKWGLKENHSLVAPAYTAVRAALAKTIGLGRNGGGRPHKI